MQEEIFGPVTCVTVFDTEAEVVERVNNTRCVYIFWLLGSSDSVAAWSAQTGKMLLMSSL